MYRLSEYNIVHETENAILLEGVGWIPKEIVIDDREVHDENSKR